MFSPSATAGDISRKKKLLEKQKEGRAHASGVAMWKFHREAFMSVLEA